MVDMFATGDLSQVASVVSAAYFDHQESPGVNGPELFSNVVTRVRKRFPDLQVQIEDMIAEGDRVVARLQWKGTDSTGQAFQAEGIDIVRIADEKAIEHWGISQGWPRPRS